MPYIKNRECFDEAIDDLVKVIRNCNKPVGFTSENINVAGFDGTLNYIITRLCNDVLIHNNPRYSKINTILGVLEAVKLEFYRRLAGPYEDEAIEKNSDLDCYSDK